MNQRVLCVQYRGVLWRIDEDVTLSELEERIAWVVPRGQLQSSTSLSWLTLRASHWDGGVSGVVWFEVRGGAQPFEAIVVESPVRAARR